MVSTRSVAVVPFGIAPGETEPDDPRDQHRAGLPEHGRLGFDPTHSPADDAEAIHHRGVRIGADERVGIGHRDAVHRLREHHSREVLDVHLVHDAGVRRNDLEVVECALAPAEEGIALPVARKLQLRVQRKRVLPAEVVHLDRVIDDELDRLQRVDAIRVALQLDHGVAHRRQIDDARHAGEVLQQHARRHERDFFLDIRRRVPLRDARMSSAFTNAPSSRRSRFSSRTFIEYGSRETPGNPAFSSAGKL